MSGRTITFHLTRPDTEWLQKLALPPAALLPPSVGSEEIGTDVSRLVGTGPYAWASYSPARQLVLRRNPYFKAWAPAAQPDGYVDRDRAALRPERRGRGHAGRAGTGRLGRGRPAGRPAAGAARPVLVADARQPVAGRLVLRAQRQHQALQPDQGAAGRQPRDRPQRDRQDLRRRRGSRRRHARCCRRASPATRPTAPGRSAARRPGRRPTSRAPAQLVEESGTKGDRVDIVVADDRVQKAIGQYILGRALQARLRPAPQAAARWRAGRVRAELAQPRRDGALAVAPGSTRRPPSCSTACSVAARSSRTPTRAPTSAASATARRCSR